jgi:hypothetical protein
MRVCVHGVLLQDLFKRITSLSYLGDVRMGLAEDSKKVERIVAGSYSHFRDTYLPILQVRAVSGAPGCVTTTLQLSRTCSTACAMFVQHSLG